MPRLRKSSYGKYQDVPDAQYDPARNPDGIYSGMTKRLAICDGTFAEISNMPKDTRNKGRLT